MCEAQREFRLQLSVAAVVGRLTDSAADTQLGVVVGKLDRLLRLRDRRLHDQRACPATERNLIRRQFDNLLLDLPPTKSDHASKHSL